MTIHPALSAPRPPASRPSPPRPEPTLEDRFLQAGDFALSCLPGAAGGVLLGAGVGFNSTILLGFSAALKTAAVVAVIGGAAGAWVSHDLSRMD